MTINTQPLNAADTNIGLTDDVIPRQTMLSVRAYPFLSLHVAALGVFFVPFSWKLVVLCIALYYARMFFVTAGYHRYFSHRTYKVNRFIQFLIAFFGGMTFQKGALWWAANHRHHHKHSDTEKDIHSPRHGGFLWSHVQWILVKEFEPTQWELIPDLAKYPELRFLNEYYLLPGVVYAAALYFIGGLPYFFWGFVLSTVLLWHGTFTINSLSHVFGTQRYTTGDTSKNNLWLALITMGEGWHNNHHCYMSSVKQGFYWWEIDMSYYIIKAFSWLGITSDLRKPPLNLLESKRIL